MDDDDRTLGVYDPWDREVRTASPPSAGLEGWLPIVVALFAGFILGDVVGSHSAGVSVAARAAPATPPC